ncbi:MAG: GTP 3',8-cyclase MoaA [Candidatus Omnitrophota bacterium]|nr:GTP 3',8-cyclase MoaA [Candidatus Omnitrophota bacterium]
MRYLIDNFGRKIDYLRISVTEACNLSCLYCKPEDNFIHKGSSELLSFEEILRVINAACSLGITKVRLTGGEPLARENLFFLISSILEIPQVRDFSLTTNGVLLKDYVPKLKSKGLKRINVSLDTLSSDKFKYITRTDYFNDVISGIEASLAAGLLVKLNVVVMKGINDNEIFNFVRFAQAKKIILRFIELMPLGRAGFGMAGEPDRNLFFDNLKYVPNFEVRKRLEYLGKVTPCYGFASGPAAYYRIAGFSHLIGFISAMSEKFCYNCNRLRLSGDGAILPCLGSSFRVDLKAALRKGAGDKEIAGLITKAVRFKPMEHSLREEDKLPYCAMSEVGG